jgi:hypothetical protein
MDIVDDVWAEIKSKWSIMMKAKIAICGGAIIMLVIGWKMCSFYDGKESHSKDVATQLFERQILEDDRSNRDNEKLTKEVESLKVYRGKDAPPLKRTALILASQIHEYVKDWKDSDAADKKLENVRHYLNRLGLRASIVRDDLDQNGQNSAALDKEMYGFEWNYQDVRVIADEIGKLANRLSE